MNLSQVNFRFNTQSSKDFLLNPIIQANVWTGLVVMLCNIALSGGLKEFVFKSGW